MTSRRLSFSLASSRPWPPRFYDALNEYAPTWLELQMIAYGTRQATGYYPWTAATTDDNNMGPANLGQLKAVFFTPVH